MRKKLMAIFSGFLGLISLSSCSILGGFGGQDGRPSSIEENVTLSVTVPKGEAYPYILRAQQYLEAGAGANVRDYLLKVDNPYKGIKIKWDCSANVASYKVEYATKADYSDAIVEECSSDKDEIELYNLYKATKYYVRVTAQNEGGISLTSAEGSFKTTALGPRVMNIPDIHNVRDMGGYKTLDGKMTVQGILYRGGTLLPADVYNSRLTKDGKEYMSEVMGIKTEIDFREMTEAGNLTESVIPNATLEYATLSGYSDAYKYTAGYKKAFTLLADKNNYPIYYHCTGGADRTGTVSFLLNALLGVDETTCIQDYEFTSYSIYGERNTQGGAYGTTYFQPFRATLETYEGDTLQEKVESYLLSIGITKEQIANIKAIMYGEISI